MSDLVSDPQVLEALAGEYVLGTLDSAERAQAQELLHDNPDFAARVKVWERRLSELHLMVEAVEPDSTIWERIQPKPPETPQDAWSAEQDLTEVPPPLVEQLEHDRPEHVLPEHQAVQDGRPQEASERFESAVAAIVQEASAEERLAPSEVSLPPRETIGTPAPSAPARVRQELPRKAAVGRELVFWRALALSLALVILMAAGLVAAWRLAADRVPAALQPPALLRLVGIEVAPA